MATTDRCAHYASLLQEEPIETVLSTISADISDAAGHDKDLCATAKNELAVMMLAEALTIDEKTPEALWEDIETLCTDIVNAEGEECLVQFVDRFFHCFGEMSDDHCNVEDPRAFVLMLELVKESAVTRNMFLCIMDRLIEGSRQNILALSQSTELLNLLVSYTTQFIDDEDTLERLDLLLKLELQPVHLLRLMDDTLRRNKSSDQPNIYIRRLISLLKKDEDTHFLLNRSSLTFNLLSDSHFKSYTLQLWIKFNNLDNDNGQIINIDGKTRFKLEGSQLSVYYKETNVGTFDSYDFNSDQYYHIVLVHSLSTTGDRTRAKLSLYVNGTFVQLVRCRYPFPSVDDAIAEMRQPQRFHLTLGSMHADISVTNLGLFSGSLPTEWIALSYHLGTRYRGLFQDEDLLKFLNYRERTEFNLKLLDCSTQPNAEFDLKKLQLQIPKSKVLLNFNAESIKDPDFRLDGCNVGSDEHIIIGKVLLFRSKDVTETFYSISALQLAFALVETSKSIDTLYESTELLLELVSDNWKIIREMEFINGYSLLATLLKLKKTEFEQSFSIELFDMILRFVGFNFDSPFNSIIMNHLIYDQIILDLQLWKPVTNEETEKDFEVIRFLIFQVIAFTRECKYNSFNVMKLKKLKIVKRLFSYLSQGFFPDRVRGSLQDALSLLVRSNLSVELIRTLTSFIVYSLNEGNESNSLLGLRVLGDVYLDPQLMNATQWKKLFGTTVSMKYIFLLLQLGKTNKLVIDIGLTLLIKLLIMSNRAYDVFIKNNGPSIVIGCMRDIKIDKVEISVLINGSIGKLQTDLNFSEVDNALAAVSLDKVSILELHHMIFDLLEWTVLNDIFKADDHDSIIQLIDGYTSFLDKAFQRNPSFVEVIQFNKSFIRRLCNLVLLLNKPRNATVYFDSSTKVVELLSSRMLAKLLNSDLTTVESYISELMYDPENGTDSLIPSVYLALVFPNVLVHLLEFSSEFGMLLQANSLNFPNVAAFLNLLYGELLTFEWASKDYFNYLSVVLSILEAYANSGKSLRNTQFQQLQKNITPIMNALVFILRDSESVEQKRNFLKIIMFHQQNIFTSRVLTSDGSANLISLLLQIATVTDQEASALALNCLRIIIMHSQDELSSICSCVTFISHATALKFLQSVTTISDEEVISKFTDNKKVGDLFRNHLEAIDGKIQRKFTRRAFMTTEAQLQDLYNRHDMSVRDKYETIDKYLTMLKNDNEILRQRIVHTETTLLVRFLKDQYDLLQFHISAYNKIKLQTKKRLELHFAQYFSESMWILDSMEGIDRIRKRLLPYDDLEKDQQLKNIIDVPIKKISAAKAVDPPRVESLSLNSFDMVEEDAIEDSLNNYNDRNRKVLKSLFPGDRIVDIWNVSQVVGLEINEGILILGQSHIYLIQEYFHKPETDEIIDINDAPKEFRDPNVQLISGQPRPKTPTPSVQVDRHAVHHWDLYKLTSVTKRQFLLRDVALELFFSNGASFLVTSIRTKERDAIFSKLSGVATNSNIDNDLSAIFKETNINSTSFTASSRRIGNKLSNVFHFGYENVLEATKKWQSGEMSNFYYLVIINTLAGRTFNDLTQYPVFPWVISDYTSDELDLTDPKSFRDLSKPMGAQNPQRAQQFKERYEALDSLHDELSPPFHYGTHYSSAMIVASFLIRLEPFVQSFLLLQGGKFDHADRLFYSVEKAWKSASSDNTTDVRELIPEFFFLPEFLTNINGYDFGKLQDGTHVSDVTLPRWAKGDPNIFIEKNREALESPYVSAHLHEWIDLIFGFKQTGPRAVEAINVFNHLSYHGAIDLDAIDNEVERRSIIGIIHNFGQTPAQIFPKSHPSRENPSFLTVDMNTIKQAPLLLYQTKFKGPIHYLQFKTNGDDHADAFWRGYPKLCLNGEIEIKEGQHEGSLIINRRTFEKLHDEAITALARVDKEVFITGSQSGVIHVWRYLVVAKGFKEQLDFETKLTLHIDPIKELKISPEYNLLVSLDTGGVCYVWDLAGFKFIRKVGGHVDHVAIAYDTGMIATSIGCIVSLFTINGHLICEKDFNSNEKITALNFANSRTVSTIKINNVESHEYWNHCAILTTGWSSGEICLDELVVVEAGWSLKNLRVLKLADSREAHFTRGNITIVESYLKSFVNYEDQRGGKMEIVAGDDHGRVAVWR